MRYSIIVAHDLKRGIAKDNIIPWDLPSDRRRFRDITTEIQSVVVMGRKTWNSLPRKPLPNRINIVMSTSITELPGAHVVSSSVELNKLLAKLDTKHVFFIGGTGIYEMALREYSIDTLYITEIFSDFSCDTFFPEVTEYDTLESEIVQENDITYRYSVFGKNIISRDNEEVFYLYLLDEILKSGQYHNDRTGIGTLALFGSNYLTFDLKKGFPLLTTKKVYWRGVAEELFFFLRGHTDNKYLLEKKVGIWTANSSRECLDKLGLHNRKEGDLGPVYGWQWRHFGANYVDSDTNYDNEGYDQIAEVVRQLREDRGSRRIILSAWNPVNLSEMCLPPCHVLYQFNVEKEELSCCMYQRSADMFLGAPFNIASTALLTHLLAKTCNLSVGRITIYYGNMHIYLNHIKQVQEQVSRKPYPLPKLEINKKERMEDYTFEDLTLYNYKHHAEIKASMAV